MPKSKRDDKITFMEVIDKMMKLKLQIGQKKRESDAKYEECAKKYKAMIEKIKGGDGDISTPSFSSESSSEEDLNALDPRGVTEKYLEDNGNDEENHPDLRGSEECAEDEEDLTISTAKLKDILGEKDALWEEWTEEALDEGINEECNEDEEEKEDDEDSFTRSTTNSLVQDQEKFEDAVETIQEINTEKNKGADE